MYRRLFVSLVVAAMLVSLAACHHNKVENPIANIDSKQPDKVLFDKAMEDIKHHKYDRARLTLQTLINTYPDSEFLARAKLGIGDCWYAEGGTTSLTQAESEYKDFITFFPNLPEAAEAQMKVGNIHYDQIEKPDRDYTHAKRAEAEYRTMIQQFPDSKLVGQAKAKLRDVQELLAEREFLIGSFYYKRGTLPAAMARLKSVVDAYPLFSDADQALFLLGDANEKEAALLSASKLAEPAKSQLVKEFQDHAAEAYSRILTRYPAMERAGDARKRLEAMHRPVPSATPEMLAQNKAEQQGRKATGKIGRARAHMHKRPDFGMSAKTGEPTLVDPAPTNATEIARHADKVVRGGGSQAVTVEKGGTGTPAPNEPTPRSEPAPTEQKESPKDPNAISELKTLPDKGGSTPAAGTQDSSSAPAPAPAQVNEAAQPDAKAQSGSSSSSDDKDQSSSKSKKKKKLFGLIPR